MTKLTYFQAGVTEKERKEIEVFLIQNNIRNKSDWIRNLMLKEVRNNNAEYTEPVQTDNDILGGQTPLGLDLLDE